MSSKPFQIIAQRLGAYLFFRLSKGKLIDLLSIAAEEVLRDHYGIKKPREELIAFLIESWCNKANETWKGKQISIIKDVYKFRNEEGIDVKQHQIFEEKRAKKSNENA